MNRERARKKREVGWFGGYPGPRWVQDKYESDVKGQCAAQAISSCAAHWPLDKGCSADSREQRGHLPVDQLRCDAQVVGLRLQLGRVGVLHVLPRCWEVETRVDLL